MARLPIARLASRAAVVLPLAGMFAILAWFGGNREIAVSAPVKSFLSTFAVLTVVGATPLPKFLGALAWMRAPRSVLSVAQFVYRYIFVISEQAQHMRAAALARGGRFSFRGASAAVAVLFAKSYERAERIHHAMLARGFSGVFPAVQTYRWRFGDSAFITIAAAACVGARLI
jgi:energy-coupling factor transporter transmembrane protein EcfT